MTISPDDEGLGFTVTPRVLTRASMVTPGDWIELDLDPTTRHTSIRRAVRRAIVRSPGLAGDAVRLLALLDRTSSRAVDAGAVYCASWIIDDADGDLMVATVLLQFAQSPTTTPPDLPPWIPRASASERCESVAQVIENDAKWAGADVRVVPLSFVGPSVRLHVEDGGVIVQYLVPLVDPTADIVLTFSCPCPPYARLMTAMFDDMAQSLQLHCE
jgi:hypothetical protein